MPNEDIAEMFLNLTEHPYAGTYSSSREKKKTRTGRKRDVAPQTVRIQFSAPRK